MTRKEAIEELQCDLECGEFYNPAMKDSVEKAISDMQKLEQIEELVDSLNVSKINLQINLHDLSLLAFKVE